jgi:ADP-ribosylglycohydrolase
VITTAGRIAGLLTGIAVGDAVGKQTEGLSREAIARWYPDGVRGFEGTPRSVIPRYSGNRKREWRIGETTDDTERTVAVARAILQDGGVRRVTVGRKLLACVKCVHPGLRSLWEFHQAGDPARVATRHDGCGAAVRVSPVGAIYPPERLDDLVHAAQQASIPTHGGALAIAAAAATAAAVSAAIAGWPSGDILGVALSAATRAERLWPPARGTSMAAAIRQACDRLAANGEPEPGRIAEVCFPDTPLTIVPLALALATRLDSAERAILVAANVGGDSDSVASIAGGVLGARAPDTVNQEWHSVVEQVNHHGLQSLAVDLGALRAANPEP